MVGESPDIAGEGPISNLGDLEGWWNNHAIVAWSFALFGCFLLNVILLLAFLIRPSLRTISNRFVMNLTVSNLLVCAVMNPLIIMDVSISPKGSITDSSSSIRSICGVSEGAVMIVTTSSVLSVLLIAVDQYFAVVDPLRYRARIDKLKSGILIMSIWLISIIFGLLAFLNPSPQSLWLSCMSKNQGSSFNVTSLDSFTEAGITAVLKNETKGELNISEIPEIVETIEGSIRIDGDNIDLIENTTVIFDTLIDGTITYGFIYTVVYFIFAYFIPFTAVCWIYVSIYVAAHRNSERARKSGSRPILSSGSFTEEQNAPRLQRLQIDTIEDFRKLPKISSLSSIDETSETMQPTGQLSRRRSFSSTLEIEVSSPPVEDKTSSGIVFTVGLQRVEISQSANTKEEEQETCTNTNSYKDNCNIAIDGDVADYGQEERRQVQSQQVEKSEQENLKNHEGLDVSQVLEELVIQQNQHPQMLKDWISRSYIDDCSDSEDERNFECFQNLEVLVKNFPPSFCDYPSNASTDSLKVPQIMEEENKSIEINNMNKQNNESAIKSLKIGDGQKKQRILQINPSSDTKNQEDWSSKSLEIHESTEIHSSTGEARIPSMIGDSIVSSETFRSRQHRFSTFINKDVLPNTYESASYSSYNKTERENEPGTESSACLLTPIVTITPAPSKNDNLHRVSSVRSTSSYINSLKDRISNGSIFRHREEARAARISALVIVMGLICWSPYVILLVMKNLPRSTDQHLPHKYDVLASSLLILAAYISPLLFGYRSKRVKRELRRFFCFRRELSYKNNRSLMAKKVLKRRHSSTLSHFEMDHKYNIFNCVYGRNRWPKEKVQFVQVPDTALAVETCRSSFSSGASTQISSTSTEEC